MSSEKTGATKILSPNMLRSTGIGSVRRQTTGKLNLLLLVQVRRGWVVRKLDDHGAHDRNTGVGGVDGLRIISATESRRTTWLLTWA